MTPLRLVAGVVLVVAILLTALAPAGWGTVAGVLAGFLLFPALTE